MAAQRKYPEELRDRAVKMVLGQAVCQPEKRKVGSSTLPLTTSSRLVCSVLTSANADQVLSRLQRLSDHDCPCVTVVGRSLSHVDRTPRSSVRDSTAGRDHYRFDRVLVGPLDTLPGRVIGAKPAACLWIFSLLGAVTGDILDDLSFGSGAVGRAHQLAGARAMRLTYPWSSAASDASHPSSDASQDAYLSIPLCQTQVRHQGQAQSLHSAGPNSLARYSTWPSLTPNPSLCSRCMRGSAMENCT
jgi:hypothetical protein